MIRVSEAKKEHFHDIYPLLRQLNDSSQARVNWEKSFDNPFGAPENNTGFMLVDGEKVAGFIGCIYAHRIIGDKIIRFCNTHSWVVDPSYRSKGLLLLNRVHKLTDYVLTNYSASEGPFRIMKKLGWKEKSDKSSIIFSNPMKRIFHLGSRKVIAGEKMTEYLSNAEADIYQKHQFKNTLFNVVADNEGNYSFQVFKKVKYKPGLVKRFFPFDFSSLSLGKLYYVSNPEFFFNNFRDNADNICIAHGLAGLIIQDEYLNKYDLGHQRPYMGKRPLLYRDNVPISVKYIDLLYSEIFVLDLI